MPALLACSDLSTMSNDSQETAACSRERMLWLPHGTPTWHTAHNETRPCLKSRAHEAWRRGQDESSDLHRQRRGSWRRLVQELEAVKELYLLQCDLHSVSTASNYNISFRLDLTEYRIETKTQEERRGITEKFQDKQKDEATNKIPPPVEMQPS